METRIGQGLGSKGRRPSTHIPRSPQSTSMATTPFNPLKKANANPPPKRGQIKAQIFEGLVKTVVSAASKAGEALGRIRGEGGTPPPSTYNSDGSSDIS